MLGEAQALAVAESRGSTEGETQMSNARVTIKSDGTPQGTHILIDGKQLDTTFVSFAIGMDDLAKVEVRALMYVDEIAVDGVCDLTITKEPDNG
jgi:hypothetical protein